MDLKVVCYCGQKYKFDVQPVDGRMPHAVSCPVCGVDGTPLANQLISQQLASSSAPPPVQAMVAPIPAMITPPPPMAVPASAMAAPAPMPPAPAPASGLKINIARPAAPDVPPPLPSSSVPPPLGAPRPMAPLRPAVAAKAEQKEYNQGLGILGAFLGAAVGGGLTYGFYAMTDFRFPLMGTAIGILAGVGARVLARGTDTTLGAIAAAFALVAVVAALFFMYGGFPVSGIFTIAVSAYFAYRIAS
ncbi:MAG TPA: hypothetical protein VMH87_16775 [Pseudomonadales bacterium]|nr:hypothetical protein [Pseudomonadales bacterium]